MLLNATHEITHCGLPDHVQDRYIRYKQGNRAIVAWMTRYGPEHYKGRKTLPIKQLIALGWYLCERKEEIGCLPSDVDYYFKEVIKERTYLSQHFRGFRDSNEKDETDTVNHEHFTKSLKEIHHILLNIGQRSKTKGVSPAKSRRDSNKASPSEIGNRFGHLSIDQLSDGEESTEYSDADTEATSECSHGCFVDAVDKCKQNPGSCEDFLDIEGGIAVALEASMFLSRIEVSLQSRTLKVSPANSFLRALEAIDGVTSLEKDGWIVIDNPLDLTIGEVAEVDGEHVRK